MKLSSPSLQLENKTLTYHLAGDLVSTSTARVRDELASLLAADASKSPDWKFFRLNLTTTDRVDSAGLNLIVALLKAVQKAGAKMQIVYSNANLLRLLQFTRLDQCVELIQGGTAGPGANPRI
jgi:anti-anti-sigma factor